MLKFNRVILGTENKEKCKTIKKMLKKYKICYNHVICTSVESGVDESPINNETFKGAKNRVKNCIKIFYPEKGDLYVGLESGLYQLYEKKWYEKCICYVKWYKTINTPINIVSSSEEYPLCDFLNNILNSGKKHRDGMHILRQKSKNKSKDTFAIYTNNEKKRVVTFEQSFGNCLLNIKNYKLCK